MNKNDKNTKTQKVADWEFPMIAVLLILIVIVPLAISIWDIGMPYPGKK